MVEFESHVTVINVSRSCARGAELGGAKIIPFSREIYCMRVMIRVGNTAISTDYQFWDLSSLPSSLPWKKTCDLNLTNTVQLKISITRNSSGRIT